MKKLLTTVALTTLLAAPAFAQTTSASHTQSQARMAPAAQPGAALSDEADSAYASYIGSGFGEVIENGESIGRDPDPNVRLQLRRDADIKDSDGAD